VATSVEQLQQVPLLSGLGKKDLERLAGTLRERTFPAGHTVTEEGKNGVGFFVIESGDATVTRNGQEVRKLGPGDYFGEIALITPEGTRTATIVADTELKCHGLTAWDFKAIVEAQPTLAWGMLETLAKRLGEN
jgi:CRP-like cAMP-binding protein